MNHRMIGKLLGFLLLLECMFLFPSVIVSALYHEETAMRAVFLTMVISAVLGGFLLLAGRGAERHFYAREGMLVTALGWIVLSAVGALPFVIAGEIPNYIDALFEVISGFTTTGASILTEVEPLSKGLLF